MRLIYKGKFSGNEADIPSDEHRPGAKKFKEPEMKTFMVMINIAALVISVSLIIVVALIARPMSDRDSAPLMGMQLIGAAVLSMLVIFPHELLHALCFKKEVYLFTYFKSGAAFVVGNEDMSKTRFVIMSLFPNLVFGFLPYILFLLFNELVFLGALGALCIGQGAGDYLNVFNALTQVPNGAKIYMHGFHTYWYVPDGKQQLQISDNERR